MAEPQVVQINNVDGSTIDAVADEAIVQDANYYVTANWVITGGAVSRTVTVVASQSSTVTRLTLSPEMLTGESLTLTIDSSIISVSTAETFNPSFHVWTAAGEHPGVLSSSATAINIVRVTFDEPMLADASLSDVASYSIDNDIGSAPMTVVQVTPEGIGSPTYVDLQFASEMTDDADYSVIASTSLKDAVGNTIDPLKEEAAFTGLGNEPELSSVDILDDGRKVRFNFDEPMLRNAALASILNYTFNTVSGGAVDVFASEVIIPDSPTNPTFVDVVCSEMTDGSSYEAIVALAGPTDIALNGMDPANRLVAFTGVGINPTIGTIRPISSNRVDIEFTENMKNNSDAFTASRYTWDQGLQTLSVLDVEQNIVKLVTSEQTPGTLYNLTIDPT